MKRHNLYELTLLLGHKLSNAGSKLPNDGGSHIHQLKVKLFIQKSNINS